ncbi:MAG TPA: apolipoprotein N-acyltransferase, partial [Rhizomicrobium sp.]|nr:apolipoprotein N-acyltransferase [Rhizomicrobium sp.]
LLALVTGLLSALAFAPFCIFPFLLIAFAMLVLFIDGARRAKRPMLGAFAIGWVFGFGHFLAGLYWVGYAFMVNPSAHEWQIPFVAILLPGGLALFPAVAALIASLFWRAGTARILIFTLCYAAAEWLRGHVFTGFPWNIPAYGWGASLGVLQSVALIGAYGLSVLTILFGASLARVTDRDKRAWRLPIAMTIVFALLAITGDIRLAVTPETNVAKVHLRLVQPNVPQDQKYVFKDIARNWRRLIFLSEAQSSEGPPTHIIWPEAAPPFFLAREPMALDDIAVLTGHNRVLMTGAVRGMRDDSGVHFFNSVYIFAHAGELIATYDKFHLVPFGEYLPAPIAGLLNDLGITKLVDSPGGFTPGTGPRTYAVPGAPPAGPLICYEILFPNAVVGATRPGWIVNVTDDSWFGPSSGPYQHLLTARVRAIEEGLPVARAANTGISAVIDPLGRIRASLGLDKMGVVDAPLPSALRPTPFAHLGDAGFFVLWIGCLVLAILSLRVSGRKA